MGRANENQRLTEELAATREALRQVKVKEPSLTVGALCRELSHSAQESFRVSSKFICPDGAGRALSQHSFRKTLSRTRLRSSAGSVTWYTSVLPNFASHLD